MTYKINSEIESISPHLPDDLKKLNDQLVDYAHKKRKTYPDPKKLYEWLDNNYEFFDKHHAEFDYLAYLPIDEFLCDDAVKDYMAVTELSDEDRIETVLSLLEGERERDDYYQIFYIKLTNNLNDEAFLVGNYLIYGPHGLFTSYEDIFSNVEQVEDFINSQTFSYELDDFYNKFFNNGQLIDRDGFFKLWKKN